MARARMMTRVRLSSGSCAASESSMVFFSFELVLQVLVF